MSAKTKFHEAIHHALRQLDALGDRPEAEAACRHLLAASYLINRLDTFPRPAAARDVPRGTLWAFTDHRSQQDVGGHRDASPNDGTSFPEPP